MIVIFYCFRRHREEPKGRRGDLSTEIASVSTFPRNDDEQPWTVACLPLHSRLSLHPRFAMQNGRDVQRKTVRVKNVEGSDLGSNDYKATGPKTFNRFFY